MALVDNSNWVRAMLGGQVGNLQNQFAPNGAMWEQYLNSVNPLMASVMNVINPSQAMLMGQGGMPGYMDSIAQYMNSLPGMMNNFSGSTQGAQNALSGMGNTLDQFGGYINPLMQQFMQGMGSTPMSQYLGNEITGFTGGGNPLQNMLGETGYGLMAGGGGSPYTQNMQDIASYYIQQGGMTPQLAQGMAMTGQGAGQGMDMMNTGGLNRLPGLTDAIGFGQNNLAQGGMNNFLNMGQGGIGNILGNQGQMGSINALQQSLLPEIQSGGYGQLQPGFDTAISMMNGGNISPYTGKGAELALQYASGGGPSLMSGMQGFSMPSFNFSPISVGGPGSVSRGAVDSGYTESIDEMIGKAKEILDQNPLIPMQQAISMARNQAGTATSQNMEAMMRRALARGNQGATNVQSGLQNQAMADFANEGAQNEAAAMQQAMMQQQALQLQKYGIGADLSKAMEQVAAGRNASSSQLAGQEMSANAQLQAAHMSAQAQAASQNAQMQLAAAQAQSDLFKTAMSLNAQQRMQGLQSLQGFSGQQNEQMMGGLNAMSQLQNSANNRLSIASDAFLKGSDIQSGREMGALGLIPGMSNAQTGSAGLGLQAITDPAKILSGNMGTGANLFSNMTSAIPGMQGQATDLMGTLGQLSLGAGGLDLNRLNAGAGMANSAIGNYAQMLGLGNTVGQGEVSNMLNGLGLGNTMTGTMLGGQNNLFGNNLGLNNFGLNQFNQLTGAQQGGYNAWNQGIGNMYGGIANGNNILGSLAGQQLGYMGTGLGGYAGLGAGQGGGSPLNNWMNAIQGATNIIGGVAGGFGGQLGTGIQNFTSGLKMPGGR